MRKVDNCLILVIAKVTPVITRERHSPPTPGGDSTAGRMEIEADCSFVEDGVGRHGAVTQMEICTSSHTAGTPLVLGGQVCQGQRTHTEHQWVQWHELVQIGVFINRRFIFSQVNRLSFIIMNSTWDLRFDRTIRPVNIRNTLQRTWAMQ